MELVHASHYQKILPAPTGLIEAVEFVDAEDMGNERIIQEMEHDYLGKNTDDFYKSFGHAWINAENRYISNKNLRFKK